MNTEVSPLVIAKAKSEIVILPKMANRHGLIAGATGTGKTVTLRTLAEQFSSIGVPVFMADVKGDLSGLPFPGGDNARVIERIRELGLEDFHFEGFPVMFWDVFGVQGHPVRATVSEMGPLLFSRILVLNEIQSGVLTLAFKVADDNGFLLLDLKDLRAMLQFVGEQAQQLQKQYGNISAASIGAIQRGLLNLEQQGAIPFFGEPALNLNDLMQTDTNGKGMINILAADRLLQSPKLYATFLLWMLAELFEQLPETGDPEKPKLVFFFDEAHLLFDDASRALTDKIEQVVRLIRSKGVGVYFITQNPIDLPETVLGQLGNRVQHALRAFTPRDQKTVKAAAETFRAREGLNVAAVITELEVGEALVSVLDKKGTPTKVERAYICPPQSRLTPLTVNERGSIIRESVLYGHYEKTVDRESAYEILKERAAQQEKEVAAVLSQKQRPANGRSQAGDFLAAAAKSAAHAIGSQVGRQIIRGVLGSLFGGGKRR
ncbi:MAG: helicase HerA-like domain-containing protein [Pseudomonadota bacterium]